MNRRALATLVRKDLLVVRRSRATLVPLIVVPLVVMVVLPLATVTLSGFLPESETAELMRCVTCGC